MLCRRRQEAQDMQSLLQGSSTQQRNTLDSDAHSLGMAKQARRGVETMLDQAAGVLEGMGATRDTLKVCRQLGRACCSGTELWARSLVFARSASHTCLISRYQYNICCFPECAAMVCSHGRPHLKSQIASHTSRTVLLQQVY